MKIVSAQIERLRLLYHHLFELVRTRRIDSLVTDVVSHVLFPKVEFITRRGVAGLGQRTGLSGCPWAMQCGGLGSNEEQSCAVCVGMCRERMHELQLVIGIGFPQGLTEIQALCQASWCL